MNPARRVAAALALVLPLSACGGEEDTDRTLTVLAAASLTDSFEDLATVFEAEHPGVEVRLAFDSSATLAQQALEGAPADVLATADARTMADASGALAAEPRVFATNRLVLVTPAGNPAGVTSLADLEGDGVTWVACVEEAPCGAVAAELTGEVSSQPASREVDVRAVLTRVTEDEADAGLVYRSDAVAAGDAVEVFRIPGSGDAETEYQVAPLEQAQQPGLARQFADLVVSREGRTLLAAAGFGAP